MVGDVDLLATISRQAGLIDTLVAQVSAQQTVNDLTTALQCRAQQNGFDASIRLPTQGANDWEHFVMNDTHFLIVANNYDGSVYDTNSELFKWDGTTFTSAQLILTHGARDWVHFEINDVHYLAVANYKNGDGDQAINSEVFAWDGHKFESFQLIPTVGARGLADFVIEDVGYLAIANHDNVTSVNLNSEVFRWNGTAFEAFQTIPTKGAIALEYFMIGGTHFLGVANHNNGATYEVKSEVLQWDGTKFTSSQ
eukprot:m.363704 g.363704  ORF g.363704 m.363704 type:complete len:253 (+) comp23667_c0_seq1:272-1030(+)